MLNIIISLIVGIIFGGLVVVYYEFRSTRKKIKINNPSATPIPLFPNFVPRETKVVRNLDKKTFEAEGKDV